MPSAVACVPDMIFSSRIRAAAADAGRPCTIVAAPTALSGALAEGDADLVLLDLDAANLDITEAVQQVRLHAPTATIIAFVPHVREDLAAAARAAGVDRVLARSAFVKQLPAILQPRES